MVDRKARLLSVAGVTAFVVLSVFLVVHPKREQHLEARTRNAVRTGREMMRSLRAQAIEHGALPYDIRGSSSALENAISDQVQNSDSHLKWVYLNERSAVFEMDRVYLVVQDECNLCNFAITGSGRQLPETSGRRALLGDWVTREMFVCQTRELAHDWARTHFPNLKFSLTFKNGVLPVTASFEAGLRYEYEYDDGRLKQCIITTSTERHREQRIVEYVTCDDLGRIRGIERTPDNWFLEFSEWLREMENREAR